MNLPETATASSAYAPSVTPMLRTVLLCDIVESTALVERLGDVRAVALLQRHDQLMRQNLALCHGRLIDKADGVLALFERPIQALDFALRYQRGLREVGAVEGLDLKARIGIHVGDVMTWANEPKDVLAGAKPFEVEGLAKPVAARLMNLARPGQILMSGMAQNLCHRAVGELGEAGAKLRWLMHGRYSFKGVPAPMLVHEVGEPGLSPLRAPESGAKAWRVLPLWRRPPVVALQVILLGGLGLALFWSAFRSPPAIAFAERDWVVVADLQNRTDDGVFDDSLDTALRIGLEQSRYINLVSELQIDRALERMQRQGQPVDRQLATELALREGAKAVILPTVAQVGGAVRFSIEVVDPSTGVTVYSESADGRTEADVLPAMDDAIGQVRVKLGETLSSIQASSLPLEQVTTDNLEALRAYSLGGKARLDGRPADARALYQEAIGLDPEFAMAYLRLAFIHYVESDAEGTRRYLDKALANRSHLSRREAIFLDGAEATLTSPAQAMEQFKLLAALYPDDFRAYYNFAYFAHYDALRGREGVEMMAQSLVPQNHLLALSHYLAGVIRLSLNEYDAALTEFERAESLGDRGSRREVVETHAARRDYAAAARALKRQTSNGLPSAELAMRLTEVSLPLDGGRYAVALAAARGLEAEAASTAAISELQRSGLAGITLGLRAYQPDETFAADLRRYAQAQAARIPTADSLLRRHLEFQVLAAGWMAAQSGDLGTARRMLAVVANDPMTPMYPANAGMWRALEAELAIASGEPARAVELLQPQVASDSGIYFERAVLMRAYAGMKRWKEAMAMADWLVANRGRAFAEPNSLNLWQAPNLIENNLALKARAEYARALGKQAQATEAEAAFMAAWPGAGKLALVERRFPER